VALLTIIITGLLVGGMYALIAIGLNAVFGVVRVVNFAHGEMVMIGMYAAYFAWTVWSIQPYVTAVLIALPLGFLVGLAIQRLVIQRLLNEPLMQMFATFGLLMMLQNIFLAATRGEPKAVRVAASSAAIEFLGVSVSVSRLVVLGAAIVLTIVLVIFLKRSLYGAAVRAVSQDRSTAALMGINVRVLYMVAFGISGAIALMAGALMSPIYTASPTLGFSFVLPAFAVVVLGGLGSIGGSLLGGLIVGLVEALSGYFLDPALKQAVWFILFLAVLVIRPAGLFGKAGSEEIGQR
jgi:branched-chain amino acid transport system permease protein